MTVAFDQLKFIFQEAVEKHSPAEWESYLDAVCGENLELRRNAAQLLSAHGQGGTLLEKSPLPPLVAPDRLPTDRCRAQIGPYRLLHVIGEGGMGVVYLAEQKEPVERRVALKIIKPGMDSRQVIARFEAERLALAIMDHPNIARVLDAGVAHYAGWEGRALDDLLPGCPYFVMELVPGVPITRFCDEQHLVLRERLEVFILVCHAIQHAHQKGIIHRDIKPTNILVARCDGAAVPKVIDFGVAKATAQSLTEKTTCTQFGQLIGTLEYMSPEQAQFNPCDIDTRSDVYSLGVLLYELLTGTTPFDQAQLRTVAFDETLRIIREEEPPKPSTRLTSSETLRTIATNRNAEPARFRRQVEGDLDWIVMKCLDKDRNRRYATASGLATDLERFLADEPVVARPPSTVYWLSKFVRRNKGLVLSACLVLLALVGGIIGTTWNMMRATQAQAAALEEARQKQAALQASQQSEHNAKDKLWLSLYERARAGRFSRQMGQRLDSLAALAEAARIRPDARLRDEAIAAMALPDVRRVPVACSSPLSTTALAFGGNYQIYARADAQGISIRSIQGDQMIRQIASGPILSKCLYFSPNDEYLLGLAPDKQLGVWNVASGQRVIRDPPRDCWAHAFSSDGRYLAVGQAERVICFDLVSGQEVNRWTLPTRVVSLAFHPDGGQLAVGQARASVLSIYDAESGKVLVDLPVGSLHDQVVEWHPDGELLAIASADPRVQIWNVTAKRKVATLEGHVQHVPALTFHPDGNLLASHSWDGVLMVWDRPTGRPLLKMPLAVGGRPRFSADGRWLAAALQGEQIDLLELTPSREYRTLVASAGFGAGGFGDGDISPDGRFLAVAMDPGARLWDLRSGRELAALPAGTPYVHFEGDAELRPATVLADQNPAQIFPNLLTSGSAGLQRWPVSSEADTNRLILGPPQRLSSLRRAAFARSPDGRSLGVVTVEGGANQMIDLKTGTMQQQLDRLPNGEVRALSRDGRWAASCGWHTDRVRLLNASTGVKVQEWIVGTQARVTFSPDSRTLVISSNADFSFWDVATLQQIRRIPREVALYPGQVAFTPDGKLMALEMAPAVIHLKEVATGRTVARLEDPHGDRESWLGFTPDGTELVVVSTYATAVHIWNLRAIRSRLKAMNLDWDWPEFPAATAEASSADVTIEVVPGDQQAVTREEKAQQAIERWRREVDATPDSAKACNNLAWWYLIAPEALRNVEAALPLAEKAVRQNSGDPNFRNTLGLAYYRAGRLGEAVEVLRTDLESRDERSLAYDLYVLAMCYHGVGESVRARDYYDWAVQAAQVQRSLPADCVEELDGFRSEVQTLLGIDRKKD